MILTISGNRDISPLSEDIIEEKIPEFIINNNVKHIYIGGARGIDTRALQIILGLNLYDRPRLTIVVPFKLNDQPRETHFWTKKADELIELELPKSNNGKFNFQAFQVRNIYMIDRSEHVLACHNGGVGGTQNAIDYANLRGITVSVIDI